MMHALAEVRLYAVLLSREDIETAVKALPSDMPVSGTLRQMLAKLPPAPVLAKPVIEKAA